jgi:hypothetical protein
MKAVLVLLLAVLSGAAARADWKELRPGMDRAAVLRALGAPLLENKGRASSAEWTYDCGGYVMFAGGRATFWETPKPPVSRSPQPAAMAKTPVRTPPPANLIAKS